MKINLFLIRHASSEINEMDLLHWSIITDPNITEKGKEQCQELKHYLQQNQSIVENAKLYASILCRTQETALLSIPRKVIVVSNHLKEHANFLQKLNIKKFSNFPKKNTKEQREKIKQVVGSISLNRIQYEKDLLDKNKNYKAKVFHQEGNLKTFLEENKDSFQEGDTIIIFCHGKLVRQFLKRKEKAKNCTLFHVFHQKKQFDLEKLEMNPNFKILFEPTLF